MENFQKYSFSTFQLQTLAFSLKTLANDISETVIRLNTPLYEHFAPKTMCTRYRKHVSQYICPLCSMLTMGGFGHLSQHFQTTLWDREMHIFKTQRQQPYWQGPIDNRLDSHIKRTSLCCCFNFSI
jgi:uncharacterized protein YktB (UPF0637 family)